ncbi:Clp protease N-terminal domain-containing protein [Streptomyces cyaneofuscatus]|uniref:Clp protease N-terminal domain-containing protein n=1 Tax=Streptomyces cyaneofuscatus TaxID=66883 RepID=UPI0036759E43
MAVTLNAHWGGARASDALADVLVHSRLMAVRDGATAVGVPHLVRAVRSFLAGTGRSALRDSLSASGIPEAALRYDASPPPARVPRPAPAVRGYELLPDASARALLEDLASWRRLTGDDHLTTGHLLAALAAGDGADEDALRGAGLDTDSVLRAAARFTPEVPDEDTMFARRPARKDRVLAAPAPPRPEDLRTRTSSRRSPFIALMLDHLLPASTAHVNTPLGVRRLRWQTLTIVARNLTAIAVSLAVVAGVLDGAPWWSLLAIVLTVNYQAYEYPLPLWFLSRALAAILVPAHLVLAVCCAAALDLAVLRSFLRAKRVEEANPRLPASALPKRYMRTMLTAAGLKRGAAR